MVKRRQSPLHILLAIAVLTTVALVTVSVFIERTFKIYGAVFSAIITVLTLLWLYRFTVSRYETK